MILSENYNPYNRSDFSALLELEFWGFYFCSQNQWKFISHSCGGCAGRLRIWQCPLPDSHTGVPHQALTCHSSGTVLSVCFIRARIPLMRIPLSRPTHLLRALPPNTLTPRTEFQRVNFGGTHSVYCREPQGGKQRNGGKPTKQSRMRGGDHGTLSYKDLRCQDH